MLVGTSDLAPAFQLTGQAFTASRAATAFLHWSKQRNLAAPTNSVQVQVVVAQWDDAHHSLACTLKVGNDQITPVTTVTRIEPDGQARRVTFTFATNAANAYQIKLSGSRAAGSAPFVVVERTDIAN